MFRTNIRKPFLFLLGNEKEFSIHTFFVYFDLEILWVDKKNKIVCKETMKPFNVSNKVMAKTIIEGSRGTFLDWKVGDVIRFE